MTWEEYLKSNRLYHATLTQHFANNIEILGYFKHRDRDRYQTYCDEYSYTGSWEEYEASGDTIYEAINSFNTSILDLADDPLFKSKEFGQLCSIVKEIYRNGAHNIPTVRLQSGLPRIHPGDHLGYAMFFFGMPTSCFVTTKSDIEDYELGQNAVIHCEIKSIEQVHSILGTNDIELWIKDMAGQKVPHIYPRIHTDTSWKSYENGDCEWPWQEVEIYNRKEKLFAEQDWFNIVRKSKDPAREIETKYRIKKTYANNTQLLNHFFGFLLNEIDADENFERY